METRRGPNQVGSGLQGDAAGGLGVLKVIDRGEMAIGERSVGQRLFAWLGNFRRLVVRYERHALNYLGFVQLGCILILLRQVI